MKRILFFLILCIVVCHYANAYMYFTIDNVNYCFDNEYPSDYVSIAPTADFRYGLPMGHDCPPTTGMDLENNYAGATDIIIPGTVDYYKYNVSWDSFETDQPYTYNVSGINDGAFAYANVGQGLTSITISPNLNYVGYLAFFGTPIQRVVISDLAAWCKIRFNLYKTSYGPEDAYSDDIASTPTGTWHRHITRGNSYDVSDVIESNGELWLNGERITNLEIPSTVEAINNYSFLGCEQLQTAIIPASVGRIGDMAFAGCTGLQELKVIAAEPPALGSQVFREIDTDNCTLVVPAGTVQLYQQADQWNQFKNIVEAGDTPITVNPDVNGDGVVDIDDVNIVVNAILHK